MADYKSNYTGQEIDAAIAKAKTALQEEQYTGTYSKPTEGIPESDLSEGVKQKLNSGGGSSSEIGDLEQLNTIAKNNLVLAINEVNNQIYDGDNGYRAEEISYETEETGCVLKDGTIGTNVGIPADYKTYKFLVSSYNKAYISGRQFGWKNYSSANYPWGANSCICVAYNENDEVLQYWQLSTSTNYINYEIDLPNGTEYIKVSAGINHFTPARCGIPVVTYENKKLPKYWLDYLGAKKQTILEKCNTIGSKGDSFIFITDIHEKLNFGKSPLLINYILQRTPIRKVIFGGDLWSDGNDIPEKSELMNNLYALRHKYNFTDNLFAVRGNHDIERSISSGEWYSMYQRALTEFVDTVGTDIYFYRDNTSQKIRYIFCDGANPSASIDATQSDWLKSKINELDSEWTILVFCHSYWSPASPNANPAVSAFGSSIKTAIDSVATTCNATVAGLITGHCHRDKNTTSEAGYVIVATTCDANGWLASSFDPVTPTRTEGTTSEQAFDVFNIDTDAQKIYITRIGGNGADRELTYSKVTQ